MDNDNTRASLRTAKAKKNIIAMFLIRGASICITFFYVPLLLNILDSVEYGIWLTLTSIVAWISMFDVGLGNGLRNKLGEALANDDYNRGRELISTAYVTIFILALCLLGLFSAVFPFVSWTSVLNAAEIAPHILNELVYIVVAAFFAQFALGLITSVLFALQEPFLSSLCILLGQALSFIAVFVEAKVFGISSILTLGITISIAPIITLTLITIYFFKKRYCKLCPSIRLFKKAHIKEIFTLGLQFFILQIITIILFQANNIIITHCTGPSDVVVYNVAFKLMHIPVMVFSIIVTPMWSAATDAYARGDFDWLKAIHKKLHKIIAILSVGAILLLLVSHWIYPIWLHSDAVTIPFMTSLILLCQSIFFILYTCNSYMLNGMGKLRVQMIFTSLLALLYIPLAMHFGRIYGLNGVLIVFALNAVINSIWARIQFNKLVNQTASGIWNK